MRNLFHFHVMSQTSTMNASAAATAQIEYRIKLAIAAARKGVAMTVVGAFDLDDAYINELWAVGDKQGVIQWLRLWLGRVERAE